MNLRRTDKLDIADEMLDAAISEFLDAQRHFAAMNLAGVAQELYGRQVRLTGLTDQIQETIRAANMFAEMHGASVSDKEWWEIAGRPKNSIKHFDSESDRHVHLDAEDEARFMIGDAISEHDKLDRINSSDVERFNEYARDYSIRCEPSCK